MPDAGTLPEWWSCTVLSSTLTSKRSDFLIVFDPSIELHVYAVKDVHVRDYKYVGIWSWNYKRYILSASSQT
jgi:hypothetical protein